VRVRQAADPAGIPRCDCGQPLKPDVVLFGEYLPVTALTRAEHLAAEADLMLCIGSSLEVYPVAQLPQITLDTGGKVAIITRGPTPYDGRAAARCDGDVEAAMAEIVADLDLR
jgi:NAD-dependent deacetylase